MTTTNFLAKTLSQQAFDRFCANRRWLQKAVDGFIPEGASEKELRPHVLLYGSAVSGTALKEGDADYAIIFSYSDSGLSSTSKTSVYEIKREQQERMLSQLFKCVSSNSEAISLRPQRVFHARVPIVQYRRAATENEVEKFDVSLSVDGVKNSLLLRYYMQHDPRLHLGVMCSKQWGREMKILNARRGWISPYALTIMYIYFMAATERIHGLLDEQLAEDKISEILSLSKENVNAVDSVSEMSQVLPLRDTAVDTVVKDVYDFFDFFGNSSRFDFDVSVVDIRKDDRITSKDQWLKQLENLSQADRWHLLGHENILLRDPYETHSLGRSVDFFRGEGIREAFRVSGMQKKPLSFLENV